MSTKAYCGISTPSLYARDVNPDLELLKVLREACSMDNASSKVGQGGRLFVDAGRH